MSISTRIAQGNGWTPESLGVKTINAIRRKMKHKNILIKQQTNHASARNQMMQHTLDRGLTSPHDMWDALYRPYRRNPQTVVPTFLQRGAPEQLPPAKKPESHQAVTHKPFPRCEAAKDVKCDGKRGSIFTGSSILRRRSSVRPAQ